MSERRAHITWSHSREVATIAILGRTRLNVLDGETIALTTAAVHDVSAEERLRCFVIEGAADRPFIGGADIQEMSTLTPQSARTFITSLHGLCAAVRESPVPAIAKVRGYALGGGMEVAMACDIRIAERASRWGMPEVRVGIPSVIEAALLPRLVGWGQTANLLFRGHMIDATEAQRIGLVEEVVDSDDLGVAVARVVQDIRRCGPEAVRLQKRLMREWSERSLTAGIAAGVEAFVDAWETDEPREGLTAFLEKRSARYAADD